MRLKGYLAEKKFKTKLSVDINYEVMPNDSLGIYIRTINVPELEQKKGIGTAAIKEIIKKYPKSKKITFSWPLSPGGKALTQSLLKSGVLKPETPPKSWMKPSDNIFMINR